MGRTHRVLMPLIACALATAGCDKGARNESGADAGAKSGSDDSGADDAGCADTLDCGKYGRYGKDCVVRVSGSASGPSDGLSWETAYRTVQDGIDAARCALEQQGPCALWQVWVAAGAYYLWQGDDSFTVRLRGGVQLYGGFEGTEVSLGERDWQENRTTLDGRGGPGSAARVAHVVTGADDAVIDGFTISGGDAPTSGGGMLNDHVSPEVRNCTFLDNRASSGGGMANISSETLVADCLFHGNAAEQGGGMSNREIRMNSAFEVSGCTFEENQASSGGGMYNLRGIPIVTDSRFEGNGAEFGGGMMNDEAMAEVTGCTFQGNTADWGGGMMNQEGGSVVTGCWFEGNVAASGGGGIYGIDDAVLVTSGVFLANQAAIGGGMGGQGGMPVVTNCTFTQNALVGQPVYGGGALSQLSGGEVTVVNSILWGNSTADFLVDKAAFDVSYSDVRQAVEGIGNIVAAPQFLAAKSGDVRLSPFSPCVDAAEGASAPEQDFDGNPRVDNPNVPNTGVGDPPYADMGAYEVEPQ